MLAAPLVQVRNLLVAERERLLAGLRSVPYLEPYPSHSNFILAKVVGGRDAKDIKERLAKEHGIMVRPHAPHAATCGRPGGREVSCRAAGCRRMSRVRTAHGPASCVPSVAASCSLLGLPGGDMARWWLLRRAQVRHYAKKELSGYIRISVGKPEHTDAVVAALKGLA